MRLVDAEPIEKFITDGLNNQEKSYGWAGVEILAEVHYAPTVDASPVIHAHWEYQKGVFTGKGIKGCFECSACKATVDEETFDLMYECGQTRMCGSCGAKMDEEKDNA